MKESDKLFIGLVRAGALIGLTVILNEHGIPHGDKAAEVLFKLLELFGITGVFELWYYKRMQSR
ncbi:hypothetical protein ACQE3E_03920 [Methylomonas sp. MED-D]|uniref:hypothetical protein n=1 Tax=unclassified Methylomonas TaxID=2608980 RepID=UPI0028A54758|nr:hypothetical protein [Methylomonas sp. MV1]MDT4329944.1 hypothetical protein [Methylomonas sp. MV1]